MFFKELRFKFEKINKRMGNENASIKEHGRKFFIDKMIRGVRPQILANIWEIPLETLLEMKRRGV